MRVWSLHACASILMVLSLRPRFAQAAPAEASPDQAPASVDGADRGTKTSDEAPVAKPADEPPATKAAASGLRPKPRPPTCPAPRMPAYVADWDRLAELTRADALISAQADALARRNQTVRDVSVGGVALGGLAASLGSVHRLAEGSWSKFDKWSASTGIAVGAVALFIAWLSDHNRDELFTLINQWNQRHPDQPLAP